MTTKWDGRRDVFYSFLHNVDLSEGDPSSLVADRLTLPSWRPAVGNPRRQRAHSYRVIKTPTPLCFGQLWILTNVCGSRCLCLSVLRTCNPNSHSKWLVPCGVMGSCLLCNRPDGAPPWRRGNEHRSFLLILSAFMEVHSWLKISHDHFLSH